MTDIVERLLQWQERDCPRTMRIEAAEVIKRLMEGHQRIVQWSEAYPLEIFHEPDLKKARALLEAGGMTLDSISAYCMRHVVEGAGKISRAALEPKP